MKLIYVGSSRPEAITQELKKRGSRVNFASMTLQNALLDGFYAKDKDISVISAWTISPFPKIKQLYFPPENISFKGNKGQYRFVGSINLPVINMFSKFFRVRRELKKQIRENADCCVIVYETHTPFLLAVATLRKHIKKATVIVPDLPEYMHGSNAVIRTILKKFDHKLIHFLLKKFDGYILLSEPMLEKLPKEVKKYMIMEGIFNPEFEEAQIEKEKYPTIMYTGGVFRYRGTNLLLEAFNRIDNPNYRLWIRGDGDLKDEILQMAKKDPRITYFEPMSRQELLELEQRATVLVNPTPPQDFTKYFFPSKNMEYLASGTPTIMFRLGCMPKEYDQYLFYVEGDDVESLHNKIVEVCEKPQNELDDFGRKAKEFILSKKNPRVQCSRIIEFITSL